MDQKKDIIDQFIEEPVSVTSVEDGWVFQFSESVLEQLLTQAQEHGKVVLFVKSPTKRGN